MSECRSSSVSLIPFSFVLTRSFPGGSKSLKFLKQFSLSLLSFAFIVALTPATYAVDGCSSTGFKVATNINLETGLFGVAAADFNGDGHLDLIAAPNNGPSEVLLLL